MSLSDTQKKALDQFMLAFSNYDKAIQMKNKDQIHENKLIIEKLSFVSLKNLLKFIESNKDFAKKCEHHEVAKQKWEAILREKHYPTQLKSVDAKLSYSAFKLLLGSKYLTHYKQQKENKNDSQGLNSDLLDKSCEYGIFESLTIRLTNNMNTFGVLLDNEYDTSTVLKQIQHDCKLIGNLYWTPGYLKAYEYLFAIADKFYEVIGGHNQLTQTFCLAALDCLLNAQLLQYHPASKALMKIIYGGLDITTGNHIKFNNWESAIRKLSEKGQFDQKEIEVIKKEVVGKLADAGIHAIATEQDKKSEP